MIIYYLAYSESFFDKPLDIAKEDCIKEVLKYKDRLSTIAIYYDHKIFYAVISTDYLIAHAFLDKSNCEFDCKLLNKKYLYKPDYIPIIISIVI